MPALGALQITGATIDGMYSASTVLDLIAGRESGEQ